ncbi:MAG: S46 family peptidase [Acidobacteria bacterium]|nr:S46 family peptidase [Acidobacteriota bacterium]
MTRVSTLPVVVFSLFFATVAAADEGMWMPQQIPALGDELKELGLQLDPASFADLTGFPMGAIVEINGCSATFVSPEGLIVTNHHCVHGALQYNSTPERDLINDGFLAKSRSDEPQATPTQRVYVTTNIDDVTAKVVGGAKKGIGDTARANAIDAKKKALVKACESADGIRCEVSTFFGGELFLLLTQMEIRDVRLVYAPALGVGNFGDEDDNWMWPRHTGDFGFLRAYVSPDGRSADYSKDNVPYKPAHWLKVSTRDIDPGDLTLLAGYPGWTSRLVSADEVRAAQEWWLPTENRFRRGLLAILREEGKRGRDVEIANATRVSSLENYLKKYEGVLEAFHRDGLLDRKLEDEKHVAELVASKPELAKRYEAAAKEYASLLATERATRDRDLVVRYLSTSSPMLSQASVLYKLSIERAKKRDAEREEGYQERDWAQRMNGVKRTQRTIERASDRAGLRFALLEATKLPKGQRIEAIDVALAKTGKAAPEEQVESLLDALYSGTMIDQQDVRLAMFDEPTAALVNRGDAMIGLAAELHPLVRRIEDQALANRGARYRLRPVMIEALRTAKNGRLAPDANGTLRVGFGQVKGYEPRDGVIYLPQTTIEGVLRKDTGSRPFDSPARLLELARAKRFGTYADPELGTLPVAYVTTNNVTNGSSGSSAINAWGEVCGLAFDMNWEGIAADWVVNEKYVRTVIVDSRYMLWVMDAVDGAHELLREMGVEPQF